MCSTIHPGQLGGLEEGGRVAAAGIGDERLAVARDDRVEQAEQRDRVAVLVEDVGRQDELEGTEDERSRVVPRQHGGREPEPVRRRIGGGELDRLRSPVGCEHVGARARGGKRRQREAATHLQDAPALEIELGHVPRESEPARPQLGPVGQELVLVEALLVDQALRIVGPQHDELVLADPDALFPHPASLPPR